MAKAKRRLSPEEVKALGLDEPVAGPSAGAPAEIEPIPAAQEAGGPAAAPAAAPVGQGAAWARGVGQGLTSNWGDEALGWLVSKAPSLNISAERLGEQWGDIMAGRVPRASDAPDLRSYEEARDYYRTLNRLSEKAQHAAYRIGEVTGGVTQAALLGPRPGMPQHALNFLGAPGVGAGVASGALAGAGGSEAEDVSGLAGDTTIGGLGGGIASMAGPLAGRAMRTVAEGFVQPTPAAQFLMERGADNLTLGQMDPASPMGQFEAVGANTGWLGPSIRQMRNEGAEGIQRAAMNEGLPPGMPRPPQGMTPQQQQARAYEGFQDAYDAFREVPVRPYAVEPVPGRIAPSGEPLTAAVGVEAGFDRAVADQTVRATPDVRQSVRDFLANQAGLMPALEPGQPVPFGALQEIRRNIRNEIRTSMSGAQPDHRAAALLANAEEHITNIIEQSLPEEARAALRATDARYAQHSTLERALYRAGDRPGGLSPMDVHEAVRAGSPRGRYSRGEHGGDLRDIAAAGREVLQEPPRTGAQSLIANPAAANFIVAPLAHAFNSIDPLRRAALGQTAPQQAVQAALESPAGRRAAGVAGLVMPELLKATGRGMTDSRQPPGVALQRLAANPETMGSYGPGLARAAAQGEDALITYDFMMSTTDPEYQRLKRAAAGATTP